MFKTACFAVAALLCLAAARPASAEPRASPADGGVAASQYLDWLKEDGDSRKDALASLQSYSDAFGWTNALLTRRGDARLYCAPGKLALTADQVASILDAEIQRRPGLAESPVGLVLLIAFQQTFPC